MVDFKLFKTLKIILYPSSKFNKILYFSVFLLFFYFAFYSFKYYNEWENLTFRYKSDAYRHICELFLTMFLFFMSIYPIIYFEIISNEKRTIEKLMKFLSCNQLKNNLIIISLAATLLAVLPMVILIISYAYLYDGFCTTHAYYDQIIIFLVISPLWFLFNIILVLYIIILFRNDIMIIITALYTFLIVINAGMFIDEYLSGRYGYKFLFFRHSSPINFYFSIDNFSSFNIKYSCDWSIVYIFGSLMLYFMLSKNKFMKSKILNIKF